MDKKKKICERIAGNSTHTTPAVNPPLYTHMHTLKAEQTVIEERNILPLRKTQSQILISRVRRDCELFHFSLTEFCFGIRGRGRKKKRERERSARKMQSVSQTNPAMRWKRTKASY